MNSADSVSPADTDKVDSRLDTSIVMATCSRLLLLQVALASLEREARAFDVPVEIIVVDDGSTDGTAEWLAGWAQQARVPVQVLRARSAGVAAARNVGSLAARGAWIASFDDDQIALPGWLHNLRARADESGAAVVGGALALQLPEGVRVAELGSRVRKLLGEHVPWSAAHVYDADVLPATNNVLIRSDVFRALGGYDEAFTEGGEDKDFFDRVRAAGHVAWFEPAARALHVTPAGRLGKVNLRWTALRVGAGDARLARRCAGRVTAMGRAVQRVLVAVLRDLPQWGWAKLTSDGAGRMDALCSLWYTSGYVQALMVLGRRGESGFLHTLNFRVRNGERR